MKSARRTPFRVWLVWLLVPVLLAVAGCGASGRRGGGPDADSDRPPASSGARDGDESGDSGGGAGVEFGVDVSIGGGSGSDGGSGSGGDGGSGGGGGAAKQPPPANDPTTEAFRRVQVGSCLPIHQTGYGGDWNVGVPPAAVSCDTQRAGLFRVTRTGGESVNCEAGAGSTSWISPRSGATEAVKLCLERVWVKQYCILAEDNGGGMSLGSTTAVDCGATSVPRPYNRVLAISGVYRAPADANSAHCREGATDPRTYWSLVVTGRTILVCFTYPNT
ncbi:hypothetical protein G3I37_10175 [Streptomyces anulatus]|uniref:Uncharacterized protein n=1 Tax=Streptomyces anulatus TaxID=1892 RepID=A0A7K3RBV6_STRAQ|nr:hypothetical protein [Streptomyces anulatus]NED25259.1 hypothetical protein [Streptomyces anulatus]